MSAYEVDTGWIDGGLIFRVYDGGTPQTPDVNGLLTLTWGLGIAVVVASGSVLEGIHLLDADGLPLVVEDGYELMLMLRSSTNSPISVVHESTNVSASDRFSVNDGETTYYDRRRVQIFYSVATSRWEVADWVGDDPREAGEITMYGGATAPTGWAFCDGSAVSRTTYPTLFARYGTTWGAGDGSTTFNLPNLIDRILMAAGSTVALAGTAGSLTSPHTHTLSDAGAAKVRVDSLTIHVDEVSTASWTSDEAPTSPSAGSTASGTVGAGLIGSTDEESISVLPPVVAINFIIYLGS